MKKIIIMSTKGGVGKTMLATYITAKAALLKKISCIIDLDTYGPSHTTILSPDENKAEHREYRNLESWIGYSREMEVPETLVDYYLHPAKIRWISKYKDFYSIPLYPGTFTLTRMNLMLASKGGVIRVINRLKKLFQILEEKKFDFVIIDMAPGIYLGPAQLFKFFTSDEDSIILYVGNMTDGDLLASIYDLDWIFAEAASFEIKSNFKWVFNKVPKSRWHNKKKIQLDEILTPLKKNLWQEVRNHKNLDGLNYLCRLLTTIPLDADRLFQNKLSEVYTIPFDGNVGNAMADTTPSGQKKLWDKYLLNPKTSIGKALENISESILK